MSSTRREGEMPLLDLWQAPTDAGAAIGCLATSYTFSAALFEEECLARFVGMESDPGTDDIAWLIEREERLASVDCKAALVDAHHCRGCRSLHWDLLPVRLTRGVMHAKIWLLVWSHHLRLVIGSANLTEDGCRRNQEVVGVLDYREGSTAPRTALPPVLALLQDLIENTGDGPGTERCRALLARAEQLAADWGSAEDQGVHPVLLAPEGPDVLEQLESLWQRRVESPPVQARVTSPFFDPPQARQNLPARRLREWLARGDDAQIEWCVPARLPDEAQQPVQLHAPRHLLDTSWGGQDAFYRVIDDLEEERAPVHRPLHAKTVGLSGHGWQALMVGSSNFTSAGLGIGRRRNYEANLLYIASRGKARKRARLLAAGVVSTEPIPGDCRLWDWQPLPDETAQEESMPPPLPQGFGKAVLSREGEQQVLRLAFHPHAGLPAGWVVSTESPAQLLIDEQAWRARGAPERITLPWADDSPPPSGLEVRWPDVERPAWWPVEVEDQSVLPQIEALRNLDLDTLIHALTSARPLHRILAAWRRYARDDGQSRPPLMVDFHARVDTRHFMLQRIRRVSWALSALRERLERPVYTEGGLHWRVHGPIGPLALARALQREIAAHGNRALASAEQAFVLTELALELAHVQPQTQPGALGTDTMRAALLPVIEDILAQAGSLSEVADADLRHYVTAAQAEAGRLMGRKR